MPTVLILQHHAAETPGAIAEALTGTRIRTVHAFAREPVPVTMDNVDALVVMGGPQSVYEQDRFPYLRQELRLIEDALHRDLPILGVCLGSQLLAAALGADVTPGKQKELGWLPVTVREDPLWGDAPRQFTAFHWHGDVFALPAGATLLASSALTPVQAFRHGKKAIGLLFHLEVTAPQVAEIVTLFADALHPAGVDARAILAGMKKHLAPLQAIGAGVFGRWATLIS
jgi:GMP synthase (glutamine-hydrolysing)